MNEHGVKKVLTGPSDCEICTVIRLVDFISNCPFHGVTVAFTTKGKCPLAVLSLPDGIFAVKAGTNKKGEPTEVFTL